MSQPPASRLDGIHHLTADEPIANLGRRLQLPPWLKAEQGEIEQHLAPLTVPDPIGR